MFETLTHRIRSIYAAVTSRLQDGKTGARFTAGYLLVTTLLVYLFPRSLPSFILLLASAYLIYSVKMKVWQKVLLGVVLGLVVIPVVGVRNISYLEVIFQISLFAALALGLNIVVGFAGMLNLGYVAFYAVGAYLWAFFGSQQMFMLHSIPGTQAPTSAFFLPPNTFFLFLFLGHGPGGGRRHFARPAGAARARRLPGDRDPRLWRGHPRAGQQPG